jgi:hypothetical protein
VQVMSDIPEFGAWMLPCARSVGSAVVGERSSPFFLSPNREVLFPGVSHGRKIAPTLGRIGTFVPLIDQRDDLWALALSPNGILRFQASGGVHRINIPRLRSTSLFLLCPTSEGCMGLVQPVMRQVETVDAPSLYRIRNDGRTEGLDIEGEGITQLSGAWIDSSWKLLIGEPGVLHLIDPESGNNLKVIHLPVMGSFCVCQVEGALSVVQIRLDYIRMNNTMDEKTKQAKSRTRKTNCSREKLVVRSLFGRERREIELPIGNWTLPPLFLASEDDPSTRFLPLVGEKIGIIVDFETGEIIESAISEAVVSGIPWSERETMWIDEEGNPHVQVV